ncbi:flagellar hook assembly protein FlgD [Pelomonas sp. KK5]|uniref:flagellar hook assembly protein FlgD n=1 Tax=Pelomonas sp. KK5 TaxID=1855730 RepID=UPI00097C58AA|nr:flagellar hook capping FlgD N-terminal domain-containing protein [Pelomonas sp. KK5]
MDATINNTSSNPYTALNPTTTTTNSSSTESAQDTQDRFLKLLVAQMQNQDPMNPMDNAQVTTQLAQIQTVTGISTLNGSIGTLGTQFGQMQALQSVSLVGHEVSTAGNQFNVVDDKGVGGFQLSSAASAVQLDVVNAAGATVYTEQLGPTGTGMQNFSVDASKLNTTTTDGLTFKITATSASKTVTATTYAQDKVLAINTNGGTLSLQLQTMGLVPYSSVTTVD